MVFHWSLSDSKSPQVSRTLLSILAVLNNVVVWMVSTRQPTSNSSSPFSNPLVTIPNAPITLGIIVTCMFHSFWGGFFQLAKSRYLSFFSNSFSFILWSAGTAKSTFCKFFIIIIIIIIIITVVVIIIIYYFFSVSCWSFTGVWVTASLLKSPRLVSVFWPISIM